MGQKCPDKAKRTVVGGELQIHSHDDTTSSFGKWNSHPNSLEKKFIKATVSFSNLYMYTDLYSIKIKTKAYACISPTVSCRRRSHDT